MHFSSCLGVLLTATSLSAALPAPDNRAAGLRLIKTSEEDPGKWVTEDEKISQYAAKKIDYIDITDIRDPDTLARLSGSSPENGRLAAPVYPTTLTHQSEANTYISRLTTTGPQAWLKTLSE